MIRKKSVIILAIALGLSMAVFAGCGDISDTDTGEEGTFTGSGYEYRAYTYGDQGSVEYLDATVDIDEAEFVRDDFDEQVYLVLHMDFKNDSSSYRSEGDEDTDFYLDCLDDAFVIQAVQNDKVTEHRDEFEAETIEESNCWKQIDSGKSLECELYFPVELDSPVTVQVLNPDGEDTVMAELTYTPPEEIDEI